ncbi:NHL repeat family protein [Exiguobacterium sp. S17]|nr:NHL repeat family protein [Exiguobacterium sp. S17]
MNRVAFPTDVAALTCRQANKREAGRFPTRSSCARRVRSGAAARVFSRLRVSTVALLITGGLVPSIVATDAASQRAANNAPLVRERTLAIPNVPTGPYTDSLALDLAGGRLFATPQAAKAVAIIDLARGTVARMLTGVGNPHGIVYANDRLFVSDGEANAIKVFDGRDFSSIKEIRVAEGADMASFDPVEQIFWVSSSGGAPSGRSLVTAIDTRRMEAVGTVEVDTDGIEGSAIDSVARRLYVTMRDKGQVGVIDLTTRRVVATWKMPGTDVLPWAVAVDHKRRRIVVACREAVAETGTRGAAVVLDSDTGRLIANLPTGGWADGVHLDPRRGRIYVSSGLGRVDSYAIDTGGRYRALPPVDTALLGKASLFSPELNRLFVSVPHLGARQAAVLVLKPVP